MGGAAQPVLTRAVHRLLAVGAVALTVGLPARARAHPLHTTLATITYDPATRRVRAVVRVFLDDFTKAVTQHAQARIHARSGVAVTYADGLRYLASSFEITGPSATPIQLASCGIRRTGDLVWLCLEGVAPFAANAMRIRDAVLCELFEDQVNIVQSTIDGTKRTTLFTPGDRLKAIAQ